MKIQIWNLNELGLSHCKGPLALRASTLASLGGSTYVALGLDKVINMKTSFGNINSPVWMIGDSPPESWKDKLEYPFDPKHPTRHSIWTPIENHLQMRLFEKAKSRLNIDNFFIINSIESSNQKPKSVSDWDNLNDRIIHLQHSIKTNSPILILTFGAFAFEILRRVLNEPISRRASYWGCERLGLEFEKRVNSFDSSKVNLIPLLHATISRGKFLDAHRLYCQNASYENYFEYTGDNLADLFINKFSKSNIWA